MQLTETPRVSVTPYHPASSGSADSALLNEMAQYNESPSPGNGKERLSWGEREQTTWYVQEFSTFGQDIEPSPCSGGCIDADTIEQSFADSAMINTSNLPESTKSSVANIISSSLGIPTEILRRKSLPESTLECPVKENNSRKDPLTAASLMHFISDEMKMSARDLSSFRSNFDGTDGIFSKDRLKGVYSKVLSGSHPSQEKNKDEKVLPVVEKPPEFLLDKRNSDSNTLVICCDNSTTSCAPLTPVYPDNPGSSIAPQFLGMASQPCLSCSGSAVPSISLPQNNSFYRSFKLAQSWGDILANFSIAVVSARRFSLQKSCLPITEPVVDVLANLMVPPLNSAVDKFIKLYLSTSRVASYVRAAKLTVIDTNFITLPLGSEKNANQNNADLKHKEIIGSSYITEQSELNSSSKRDSKSSSHCSSDDNSLYEVFEELRNYLLRELPAGALSDHIVSVLTESSLDSLKRTKLCRLLAMFTLQVLCSHLLPQHQWRQRAFPVAYFTNLLFGTP